MADNTQEGAAATAVPDETQTQDAPAQPEQTGDATGSRTSPSQGIDRPATTPKARARQAFLERMEPSSPTATAEGEGAPEPIAEEPSAESADDGEYVEDAQGRRRDPKTGKFIPKDAEGSAEEAEATDGDGEDAAVADGDDTDAGPDAEAPPVEASDEQEEDTASDDETAAEKPQSVRIEVPSEVRRTMGLSPDQDHIEVPAELEQVVRWNVNNVVRHRDAEELKAQLQRTQKEAEEYQDRLLKLEASRTAAEEWKQSDDYKAIVEKYHRIRDNVGAEEASEYWQGQQHKIQELRDKKYQERKQEIDSEKAQQHAQQWATQAWQRTNQMPPEIRNLPDFGRWFNEELKAFDARLQLGQFPEVRSQDQMHKTFQDLLTARVLREPTVRSVIDARKKTADQRAEEQRQQAAEKKAEVEAKKREEAKLKEAAQRHKTKHPMGKVPSEVRTGQQMDAGPDKPDFKGKTASEIKRIQKERVGLGG